MTIYHYVGVLLVLSCIVFLGVYSGVRAKRENDFDSGKKNSSTWIIVGTIIGALVGGSSTVGTVELSYTYGFSAWWFTLGGGIGCLILACFFSRYLQGSKALTLPEIISSKFGYKAGFITTILTSTGNFLTVVSQILAGSALITSITSIPVIMSIIIIAVLMLIYVVFGGSYSAGYVGIAKTILVYIGFGICGIIALVKMSKMTGAYSGLYQAGYFSLFSRGFSKDFNSGLSLIAGVLTTQSYLQAVIRSKSYKAGKKGLLLCSILIPLIGLAGIVVGMYMQEIYPNINPAHALCIFVLENTTPIIGGAIIAVLLVSVVGTGAGITLGISTMFTRDIYSLYINKRSTEKGNFKVSQITIIVVIIGAGLFASKNLNSLILDIGYLSMALRGAAAFAPLCFVVFFNKHIDSKIGIISIILGPLIMIFTKYILHLESGLLVGVIVSFLVIIIGSSNKREVSSKI